MPTPQELLKLAGDTGRLEEVLAIVASSQVPDAAVEAFVDLDAPMPCMIVCWFYVVDDVTDAARQLSLEAAREHDSDCTIGDALGVPLPTTTAEAVLREVKALLSGTPGT